VKNTNSSVVNCLGISQCLESGHPVTSLNSGDWTMKKFPYAAVNCIEGTAAVAVVECSYSALSCLNTFH
jgi:hypothetical protein